MNFQIFIRFISDLPRTNNFQSITNINLQSRRLCFLSTEPWFNFKSETPSRWAICAARKQKKRFFYQEKNKCSRGSVNVKNLKKSTLKNQNKKKERKSPSCKALIYFNGANIIKSNSEPVILTTIPLPPPKKDSRPTENCYFNRDLRNAWKKKALIRRYDHFRWPESEPIFMKLSISNLTD